MNAKLAVAAASFGCVLGFLAISLAVVGNPSRWPEPERPPHQGEALDATALADGVVRHSPDALDRLVREPQNAWTNLGFVAAGIWILVWLPAPAPRNVGSALVAVGIGSFLYHASASRTLRHLDVAAMDWLYVALIVLAFASMSSAVDVWVRRRPWTSALGAAGLGVVIAVFRNVRVFGVKPLNLTHVTVFTVSIVGVVLLVHAIETRRWSYWCRGLAACGLFAAASVLQLADRPGGWFCHPACPAQGHSLWHLFSAGACAMLTFLLAEKSRARVCLLPEAKPLPRCA